MRTISGRIRALRRRAASPRIPLTLPSGEQVAIAWHEPEQELLVVQWQGYNPAENIRLGAELLLTHLGKAKKVLSDGSRGAGDWSELVPWMSYDYMPRLRAAGVHHLAAVPSARDGSSLMSLRQVEGHAERFLTFQIFGSVAEARRWLRTETALG